MEVPLVTESISAAMHSTACSNTRVVTRASVMTAPRGAVALVARSTTQHNRGSDRSISLAVRCDAGKVRPIAPGGTSFIRSSPLPSPAPPLLAHAHQRGSLATYLCDASLSALCTSGDETATSVREACLRHFVAEDCGRTSCPEPARWWNDARHLEMLTRPALSLPPGFCGPKETNPRAPRVSRPDTRPPMKGYALCRRRETFETSVRDPQIERRGGIGVRTGVHAPPLSHSCGSLWRVLSRRQRSYGRERVRKRVGRTSCA